jgi:hypothetical protein
MKRCVAHGKSDPHVVCQHLYNESGLKYLLLHPSVESPFWQAFCQKCIAVLDEEGGWSDRAREFGKLSVICVRCFKKKIRRHSQDERFLCPLHS